MASQLLIFSLYFPHLNLDFLARQGGLLQLGEGREVCSAPSPFLSPNTGCSAPGRLEMAPVQGRDEQGKPPLWGSCAPVFHIDDKPALMNVCVCEFLVQVVCPRLLTRNLPAPTGIDVPRRMSSHANNVIMGPRPEDSNSWKVELRSTEAWQSPS